MGEFRSDRGKRVSLVLVVEVGFRSRVPPRVPKPFPEPAMTKPGVTCVGSRGNGAMSVPGVTHPSACALMYSLRNMTGPVEAERSTAYGAMRRCKLPVPSVGKKNPFHLQTTNNQH